MTHYQVPNISLAELRLEIQKEYTNVALDPARGYHFHTGRRLAALLGYDEGLYESLPEDNIASFGVVRTITRGCGSRTDTPPPAAPSDTCKNVEVALLGAGIVCKFYCDGVTNPSCNQPPSLIPANGRVPAWTN